MIEFTIDGATVDDDGVRFGTLVVGVGKRDEDATVQFSDGVLTFSLPLYQHQAKELIAAADMIAKVNDELTTLVGNALTAIDDPAGIPDPDDAVGYAKANLGQALRLLEPSTYEPVDSDDRTDYTDEERNAGTFFT